MGRAAEILQISPLLDRKPKALSGDVNCAGQSAPVIVRLPGHAGPLAAGSRVGLRPDRARSRLFDSAGVAYQQSA